MPRETKDNDTMTTMQLNAEMLRNMSIIAEDENLLKRATRYLRKLVSEKQADPTELTKDEFFRHVDESKEQFLRGEYTRFSDKDEMHKWINSL